MSFKLNNCDDGLGSSYLGIRCTDSEASMSSKDYLVICGRAFARSMESASATLESPLDSSKHIIAQLLCPVQRSLI